MGLHELDQGASSYKKIKINLQYLIQITYEAIGFSDRLMELNDTDFYRVNVTGTLQELREAKAAAPNIKVNKISLIENTVVDELQGQAMEAVALDMQLVEYLKLVP